MGQDWLKMDFGTGKVTFLDAMRKEDMLQVEYPNESSCLDMGWYQDRYIISIIQDFDWMHPIKQYKTTEGNQRFHIVGRGCSPCRKQITVWQSELKKDLL